MKVLTNEESKDKTELIYIESPLGFHIALDLTYIDQVGDFIITLPTGEVINTKDLK
jgi:hypothetical protein